MIEYIREYIKKNFSPNDLEDITWYVYGKIKDVGDLSSHKYDYQIDKLTSGYLCEYYKKKFSEKKCDSKDTIDDKQNSRSKFDIPLWEDELKEEHQIFDDDVLNVFENKQNSNIDSEKIIDGIAANLANKSLYMFRLHEDLTVISKLVYKDMLINQRDMLNKINKKMQEDDCTFEEVFEMDFDNYLVEYVVDLMNKENDILEVRNSYWSVRNYIFLKMKDRYKNIVDRARIIEKTSWLLTYLLLKDGVNYNDILIGEFDDKIERMITQDEIEKNSVGDRITQISDKNKKKNRIRLAAILATAILIFSNTELGKRFFDADWLFKEPDSRLTIEDVDSYMYPKIDDIKDKDLQGTIYNVINNFSSYRNVNMHPNDRFEQLCLYRAFDSIQNHNLDIMENIFSTVKERFLSNGKRDFVMNDNYEAVSPYDSYLWYVYDMMDMAGIDVKEYVIAINQYLGILRSNMVSDVKISPYDSLSDEAQKSIQKMLKEYGKLCKKLENEMEKQQNGERGVSLK